jgi:DNA polymerase-1
MSRLVFDLESDGLYNQVTKIWCISIKDIDTGVNKIYDNNKDSDNVWILEAISRLNDADELIGHNIIGYDIPVIKKLYPHFKLKKDCKITDTLVLSRLLNPDREEAQFEGKSVHGRHSLKSWGIRLGLHKGEYNDWTQCTQEMLDYCQQDAEVSHKLYEHLTNEIKSSSIDWSKPIALENKVQEIIQQQEANGWQFDKEKALQLVALLETKCKVLEDEITQSVPKKCVKVVTINKPFKINGELTTQVNKNIITTYIDVDDPEKCNPNPLTIKGPFSIFDYESINLKSPKQVKELLYTQGWVPDQWNVQKDNRGKPLRNVEGKLTKTSPIITDRSLELIDTPLGNNFKLLTKVRKRLEKLNGLIENVREDGRISAECNTNGTNTGRMTHKVVANIPKATEDVLYGKEMRELFIVPAGKVLVGCDAASLELRMLAHYMTDPEYTEALINGDIHEFNRIKAGLNTRTEAKTFVYAMIYGAGNLKIGRIIGGTEKEGKALKERFLTSIPSLDSLNKKVIAAAERGFIKGLDGRKLPLRNSYSALNLLLQSAGAIVMKVALVILDKSLKCAKLDYKIIGNFHDEFEIECDPEDVDKVKKIAEDSIKKAGEYFKLRCPLKGEAKSGLNWAETH